MREFSGVDIGDRSVYKTVILERFDCIGLRKNLRSRMSDSCRIERFSIIFYGCISKFGAGAPRSIPSVLKSSSMSSQ